MKTRTILLSLALSLCLVATVGITVSCEKSGPEDEPMVGEEVEEEVEPRIIPDPGLSANEYEITSDGTTISEKSVGFDFPSISMLVHLLYIILIVFSTAANNIL